ncbi:MAG: sensor histidine kinase [Clostridia bacterium]
MKRELVKSMILIAVVSVLLTAASISFLCLSDNFSGWPKVLPVTAVLLFVFVLFSCYYGSRLVKRLSDSINEMKAGSECDFPELEPLHRKIEEQERIRREMCSDISHEMKTPLTTICGYAEMMENRMIPSEDMPVIAAKMTEESRHLLSMIDHLLECRFSSDDQRCFPMFDMKKTVEKVARRLRVPADEKKIRIIIDGENVRMRGDEQLFEQICYNLMENSVKYTNSRGYVWVTVRAAAEGRELIVADDGIGISEKNQVRVFERFFRGDPSHCREVEGCGLGLPLVKDYTEEMGGRISLESGIGKGTRIRVFFPL